MNKILILLGVSGVGKDTIANEIVRASPEPWEIIKFSRQFKETLEVNYGLTPNSLDTVEGKSLINPDTGNTFLEALIAAFDFHNSHIPSLHPRLTIAKIKDKLNQSNVILTDLRSPYECQAIIENFPTSQTDIIHLKARRGCALASDKHITNNLVNFNLNGYTVTICYNTSPPRICANNILNLLK